MRQECCGHLRTWAVKREPPWEKDVSTYRWPLPADALYAVFKLQSRPDYPTMPSLVRLLYCCWPRPSRIFSAALQATGLLWRWHPVSSGTIPTCRWDTLWTCAERWSACATLAAASKDWIQLQPQTQATRLRTHCKNWHTEHYFIIRMPYKKQLISYPILWIMRTSFIPLKQYCILYEFSCFIQY